MKKLIAPVIVLFGLLFGAVPSASAAVAQITPDLTRPLATGSSDSVVSKAVVRFNNFDSTNQTIMVCAPNGTHCMSKVVAPKKKVNFTTGRSRVLVIQVDSQYGYVFSGKLNTKTGAFAA